MVKTYIYSMTAKCTVTDDRHHETSTVHGSWQSGSGTKTSYPYWSQGDRGSDRETVIGGTAARTTVTAEKEAVNVTSTTTLGTEGWKVHKNPAPSENGPVAISARRKHDVEPNRRTETKPSQRSSPDYYGRNAGLLRRQESRNCHIIPRTYKCPWLDRRGI